MSDLHEHYERGQLLAQLADDLERIMRPTIERAKARDGEAGTLYLGDRRLTLKDARTIARHAWFKIRHLWMAEDADKPAAGYAPTKHEQLRLKHDAERIERGDRTPRIP